MAVWACVAGVIGARLYHVATDWSRSRTTSARILKIWKGGLGIPGGLLAGIAVGLWAPSGAACPARCWPTAPRPRCRWPRPSAAGATGSTRSCSASRPTCRGRCEISDATPAQPGLRAGTHVPPDVPVRIAVEPRPVGFLLWLDRQRAPAAGPPVRRVPARLRRRAVLGRGSAHRPRRPHRRPALNQWVALVVAVGALGYLALFAGRAPVPAAARRPSPLTTARPRPRRSLRRGDRRAGGGRGRRRRDVADDGADQGEEPVTGGRGPCTSRGRRGQHGRTRRGAPT